MIRLCDFIIPYSYWDGRTYSPGDVGVHTVVSRRSSLKALAVVDTYANFHDVRIKFDRSLKVVH